MRPDDGRSITELGEQEGIKRISKRKKERKNREKETKRKSRNQIRKHDTKRNKRRGEFQERNIVNVQINILNLDRILSFMFVYVFFYILYLVFILFLGFP